MSEKRRKIKIFDFNQGGTRLGLVFNKESPLSQAIMWSLKWISTGFQDQVVEISNILHRF